MAKVSLEFCKHWQYLSLCHNGLSKKWYMLISLVHLNCKMEKYKLCQLLSSFVTFCQLLLLFVNFRRWLLSTFVTFVNFRQLLSTFVSICQLLSCQLLCQLVNFCVNLSTFVSTFVSTCQLMSTLIQRRVDTNFKNAIAILSNFPINDKKHKKRT